jgi:hypothetical protein
MKTSLSIGIGNPASQDQLGQRIAARLNDATQSLPHDVSERLKAVRMQALAKRKVLRTHSSPAAATVSSTGTLTLGGGGDDFGLWNRIASLLPLLALVMGLAAIAVTVEDSLTQEIAEIDAELLTDDLPPDAYTDPGFVQFLRANSQN